MSKQDKKQIESITKHEIFVKKIKIIKDQVDINAKCTFLQNYIYERKFYKKNYLIIVFLICYLGILTTNTNILIFLSSIRDPMSVYKSKCYNLITNKYFKPIYRNICICNQIENCVRTCYGEKSQCEKKFHIDDNKNLTNLKKFKGNKVLVNFEKKDNVKSSIFTNEKYAYCEIQQWIIFILIFFFLGGLFGDLIWSILADLYGKRVVIIIISNIQLATSIFISMNNLFNTNIEKISEISIFFCIFGFLFGCSSFPLISLLYTYLLEIFPSTFGYYSLNTIITTYQAFSWIIALIFSFTLSDILIFYYIFSFLGVFFVFFFIKYCKESPRYYTERQDLSQKEKYFKEVTEMVLYKHIKNKKGEFKELIINKEMLMKSLVNQERRKEKGNKDEKKKKAKLKPSKFVFRSVIFFNSRQEKKEKVEKEDGKNRIFTEKSKEDEEEDKINENIIRIDKEKTILKKKNIAKSKEFCLMNRIKMKKNIRIVNQSSNYYKKFHESNWKDTENDEEEFDKIRKEKEKYGNQDEDYDDDDDDEDFNTKEINNDNEIINKAENNKNTKELKRESQIFESNEINPKKQITLKLILYSIFSDEKVKTKFYFFMVIWLIFAYIYFGLQIKVFYDNLNNTDRDTDYALFVYIFLLQMLIQYITDKVAVYISPEKIVFFFILISMILSIVNDIGNIFQETDEKRYFGNADEMKKVNDNDYVKATAMIFTTSALTLINLFTISVPYTLYRNTFFGTCRAISHFSNFVSVLFLLLTNTQLILISVLALMYLIMLIIANSFLNSSVAFREISDVPHKMDILKKGVE